MNWSILVTSFIIIFSAVYSILRARKIYNGPIIEVGGAHVSEGRSDRVNVIY